MADECWSELAVEMWDKDAAGRFTGMFYQMSEMDAIYGDTDAFGNTRDESSASLLTLGTLDADLGDDEMKSMLDGIASLSIATHSLETQEQLPSKIRGHANSA